MSWWPPGLRGKAIRLVNLAGYDVNDPIVAEIVEMLVSTAKRIRGIVGKGDDDWSVLCQAVTLATPNNPTAIPHLVNATGVAPEKAAEMLLTIFAQSLETPRG